VRCISTGSLIPPESRGAFFCLPAQNKINNKKDPTPRTTNSERTDIYIPTGSLFASSKLLARNFSSSRVASLLKNPKNAAAGPPNSECLKNRRN
jgi:hypothetical protein